MAITGCWDAPFEPGGPVTVKFVTPTVPAASGATASRGFVVMDAVDTVLVPTDSLVGVERTGHAFSAYLDATYLASNFGLNIDPAGTTAVIELTLPPACRLFSIDWRACYGRSAVRWSDHPRIWCPASDLGDFCSGYPDQYGAGVSWPADEVENLYVSQAKLLIAATLGAGTPASAIGDTVAMALFRPGDYATRRYLNPAAGDSARWQSEVWTDARHLPLPSGVAPPLSSEDRPDDNLGLGVRITWYQPTAHPNALFVRFDVRNVSADPDYRRVHAVEPPGGHTIENVYLTPTVDPDIACTLRSCSPYERSDDNATLFAADSLLVAYDEHFAVPEFTGAYSTAPGLVGLRLIGAPVGVSVKGILFDPSTTPDFLTTTLERVSYRLLSAGRAGAVGGCTDFAPYALVCSPETGSDIRIGWSVGPIASLAPGDSTHVIVALLFASPAGTFTSGTAVPPRNLSASAFSDDTRAIYGIAEELRALADSVRGVAVDGTVVTP
jgi:hypothetical protein